MADVFQSKMDQSYNGLVNKHKEQVDVPEDRRFIGFDGYQKAMDVLDPGDVVIFTSPCAFRWVHYEYAIHRGLNVFMEKPITPDGFASRKMLELNEEAKKINLKVGVGLMCRHSQARQELKARIEDGELGEILNLRAYRMQSPIASCFSDKKPAGENELMFQISRFHSFLWLSGGSFSDFFIHNIDECCWMKGMWPVKCQAQGGRHYRGDKIDQNLDNYTVEYTFPDETKFYFHGRNIAGCHQEFSSHAHGTKGYALISGPGGHRSQARIHKGQGPESELGWMFGQKGGSRPARENSPYQEEWEALMDAIKKINRTTKWNAEFRPVWLLPWAEWPLILAPKSPMTKCSTPIMFSDPEWKTSASNLSLLFWPVQREPTRFLNLVSKNESIKQSLGYQTHCSQ